MTDKEQVIWENAAISFAAGLMAQPQSFTLQSAEHCLYEGINMADLFMKQRELHVARNASIVANENKQL